MAQSVHMPGSEDSEEGLGRILQAPTATAQVLTEGTLLSTNTVVH